VVILVSVATSVSGTLDWRRWLVLGPDRPARPQGHVPDRAGWARRRLGNRRRLSHRV